MNSPELAAPIEAHYVNREGEDWRLNDLTRHPLLSSLVFATREDGVPVCVERSKLKLVPAQEQGV